MPSELKQAIADSVVIYWSKDDACWIAHSLRTDQIGFGSRVVDALADVIRAVAQSHEVAASDPRIAAYQDAPQEIQQLADQAAPLPLEIYEIAHKMVHGEWPMDLKVDLTTDKPLKANLKQLTC